MRGNFIKGISLAFLVRAPIALSLLFLSVSQYKVYSDSDIINIGVILSISSLYSIIYAQTIGNIFNKKIRDYLISKSTTRETINTLFLILFTPVGISIPLFFFNSWYPYAIFLATSQALFQWVLTYYTLAKKPKTLLFLSISMSILLCMITILLKHGYIINLKTWYISIGSLYIIPFILFLHWTGIHKIKPFSTRNFIVELKSLLEDIINSATFFPILSFLYWVYEFYPRLTGNDLSIDFNVYITIIIGLMGAIEVGLGQYFQREYLIHTTKTLKAFRRFFEKMILTYVSVFILLTGILLLIKNYYWYTVFSLDISRSPELFNILLIGQSLRILNFISFNNFYYLEIKNKKILYSMSTVVAINIILFNFEVYSFLNFIIIFQVIFLVFIVLNYFKLRRLELNS